MRTQVALAWSEMRGEKRKSVRLAEDGDVRTAADAYESMTLREELPVDDVACGLACE